MTQLRTCPKCGKPYSSHPAVSRRDGKDICPDCGTREALEDAGFDEKQTVNILEEIHKAEGNS